jgi:hypothetical protein
MQFHIFGFAVAIFQSDKNISSPVLNKELGNSSTNAIYKKTGRKRRDSTNL